LVVLNEAGMVLIHPMYYYMAEPYQCKSLLKVWKVSNYTFLTSGCRLGQLYWCNGDRTYRKTQRWDIWGVY